MLPQNVNPMLCRLVRDSFSRPGWIYVVQWDGFQTLVEVGAAGVRLTSRNQNCFNTRFCEVVKALATDSEKVRWSIMFSICCFWTVRTCERSPPSAQVTAQENR